MLSIGIKIADKVAKLDGSEDDFILYYMHY